MNELLLVMEVLPKQEQSILPENCSRSGIGTRASTKTIAGLAKAIHRSHTIVVEKFRKLLIAECLRYLGGLTFSSECPIPISFYVPTYSTKMVMSKRRKVGAFVVVRTRLHAASSRSDVR